MRSLHHAALAAAIRSTICLALGASVTGCMAVSVATTAVDLGVTAGEAAVGATTTVVKGAAKVTKAVVDKASD